MALQLFTRKRSKAASPIVRPTASEGYLPAATFAVSDDSLERAVQLGQFGKVLAERDRWVNHPRLAELHRQAVEMVDEGFAFVPEGFASIPQSINDEPGCDEEDVPVEPFLMARHAVSNAEFQLFVDAGAYQDLSLWPEEIWPHLIDFKDVTGHAGPRLWRHSRHDRRLANHPVVGVSFIEASAYTQWAGYRLPTEAEWQMVASWRLRSASHTHRRYPWGDAFHMQSCNIWASGHGSTVPADDCPAGASPNGVMQLVGNVWEWTESDFIVMTEEGTPLVGDMLMKSIRGGAFDTYFPWQATSTFRTGAVCLARVHNIGFRCAMDLLETAMQPELSADCD